MFGQMNGAPPSTQPQNDKKIDPSEQINVHKKMRELFKMHRSFERNPNIFIQQAKHAATFLLGKLAEDKLNYVSYALSGLPGNYVDALQVVWLNPSSPIGFQLLALYYLPIYILRDHKGFLEIIKTNLDSPDKSVPKNLLSALMVKYLFCINKESTAVALLRQGAIHHVNLEGLITEYKDFAGIKAIGVNFADTDFQYADFRDVDVTSGFFLKTRMFKCWLSAMNLNDTYWDSAYVIACHFDDVRSEEKAVAAKTSNAKFVACKVYDCYFATQATEKKDQAKVAVTERYHLSLVASTLRIKNTKLVASVATVAVSDFIEDAKNLVSDVLFDNGASQLIIEKPLLDENFYRQYLMRLEVPAELKALVKMKPRFAVMSIEAVLASLVMIARHENYRPCIEVAELKAISSNDAKALISEILLDEEAQKAAKIKAADVVVPVAAAKGLQPY